MHAPSVPDLSHLFARDLVPEAFAIPTSAFRVSIRPVPTTIDDWIGVALGDALAFRYQESGDRVHGIIIVQDGDVRFEWHGEPDHPLAWRATGVRRELGPFVAPWLLAAVVPGPLVGWVEHEAEDGGFDEHLEVVEPHWTLPWYAEVRTPGLTQVVAGREYFHLDAHLSSAEADPVADGFSRAMADLLRGHPSRRRHPQRRG